jgi:hypothetical protein
MILNFADRILRLYRISDSGFQLLN